jgi:hypothetical protein
MSGCAHHFMHRPYRRGAFRSEPARQAYIETLSELRSDAWLYFFRRGFFFGADAELASDSS